MNEGQPTRLLCVSHWRPKHRQGRSTTDKSDQFPPPHSPPPTSNRGYITPQPRNIARNLKNARKLRLFANV
ncbi:MAG: hypothetical protein ACREEK_04390 [Bradyrhizobium sp.]